MALEDLAVIADFYTNEKGGFYYTLRMLNYPDFPPHTCGPHETEDSCRECAEANLGSYIYNYMKRKKETLHCMTGETLH